MKSLERQRLEDLQNLLAILSNWFDKLQVPWRDLVSKNKIENNRGNQSASTSGTHTRTHTLSQLHMNAQTYHTHIPTHHHHHWQHHYSTHHKYILLLFQQPQTNLTNVRVLEDCLCLQDQKETTHVIFPASCLSSLLAALFSE